MMKKIRVWEGKKEWRRNKYSRTMTFTGEQIGFWSDGHPAFHNRGTAFWIYRTKKNEIIIHKVHWSKWTTEDDELSTISAHGRALKLVNPTNRSASTVAFNNFGSR